jgi:RNA polymerase sigma factor (sigma-70 family)
MTKKYFLSKNEIVEKEYNSIREICTNVLRSNKNLYLVDDLVQEVCLILLNQGDESVQTIYEQGYFKFYIARIITNQVFSSTSPFHKKYRQQIPFIDIDDTEEYNPLADKIWLDIQHLLTKKEKKIVQLRYVYNLKVTDIAKIMGVSTRQIYKYIKGITGHLKKKYK